MSTVIVEVRDGVAQLTLNRPGSANTLDLAMGRDLRAAAARCGEADVRAVVLTGLGKAFCFGGDLRGMMAEAANVEGYLRELTVDLHAAVSAFTRLDAPVIAAVNGTAAGAGVGLVAMADLVVAAEGAKFSLAYTGVALTPDGSTSWFLPRLVGLKRAMELVLTNRTLTAAEARDWGLVNLVVADADVLAEAHKLAARLAAGPRGAFGKAKRLLNHQAATLEAQLEAESLSISGQAATAEGREGIDAFLAKRKPDFRT